MSRRHRLKILIPSMHVLETLAVIAKELIGCLSLTCGTFAAKYFCLNENNLLWQDNKIGYFPRLLGTSYEEICVSSWLGSKKTWYVPQLAAIGSSGDFILWTASWTKKLNFVSHLDDCKLFRQLKSEVHYFGCT